MTVLVHDNHDKMANWYTSLTLFSVLITQILYVLSMFPNIYKKFDKTMCCFRI